MINLPKDIQTLVKSSNRFRYARDWRYHKDERAWLTRAPGVEPQIKSTNYERGTYYFFDCNTWKKVPREFHLEYDKLEEKPTLQPVSAQ